MRISLSGRMTNTKIVDKEGELIHKRSNNSDNFKDDTLQIQE
jgi:hypothetical protein